MEETAKQEVKSKPCCCTALVGVLVIVFAWWPVSWGAIALTVLGVVIIAKEWIRRCCCSALCKPKTDH